VSSRQSFPKGLAFANGSRRGGLAVHFVRVASSLVEKGHLVPFVFHWGVWVWSSKRGSPGSFNDTNLLQRMTVAFVD
jgi:hypothetical protein